MSSLRSVRVSILIVSLSVFAATLAPVSATARTPEERLQRHEERLQQREQRTHEREERIHEHEEATDTTGREGHEGDDPGARANAGACELTVQASSTHISSGETVTLSGKLTCAQTDSASEQQVSVYRFERGAGKHLLASANTQTDGAYELTTPALESNSILTLRAGSTRSARVIVKVAPQVTLSDSPVSTQASAGTRHGRTVVRFSGSAGPAQAGAHVALQSAFSPAGEHWRTLAYGIVDEQGEYSIAHAFRVPGQRWLRVVVHPKRGNVPAVSEALSYDVPGAQNPQLTIESSAPMSTFGQPVTISGVAAQAADQPVELLARTVGGFQTVATATTDETGAYSFSVQTEQRTCYQVRDAQTKSMTLCQGVSYELLPATAPTSAEAGQPVTFTGTLAPAPSDARIELERQNASGVGFHTIAGATVNGSSYSITDTFDSPGSYVLRIKIDAAPGTRGLTSVASAPFTLQVTPAALAPSKPELAPQAP